MQNQWVLVFAYHFPPENAVGGLRPYRFFKYLPKHGFRCHVITAVDTSSAPDLQQQTVSIPDPFSQRNGSLGWHSERAVRRLLMPGVVGIQWADHAYAAGAQFIEQHRGDRITLFSTWPPLGTHLAAWRLKRRYRLPWIADYRDPLAGRKIPGCGPVTDLSYSLLERVFMRSADVAIANTDTAEQMWRKKYPAEAKKFHLLWNGFDPELRIAPLPIPARPYRVFSHVGELYEGRTIAPVLESVARLVANGRVDPARIQIHQVGPAASACLPDSTLITEAQDKGWLHLRPKQVPKAEALHLAQTADGLMIIQPQSALQVPAKVYEYLQIGRPLLAFIPQISPVERLLNGAGIPFRIIYTGADPERFDESMLEYFSLPNEPTAPSQWFEQNFNAESQTAVLAELIRNAQPPA